MGLSDIDEDDGPPVIRPMAAAKPTTPPVIQTTDPTPATVRVKATVVKGTPTGIPVKATVVTGLARDANSKGAGSRNGKGFDFDDLFGDQNNVAKASPTQQQSSSVSVPSPSGNNNVLDDLFAPQAADPAATIPAPEAPKDNEIFVGSFPTGQADDLFDVSKPAATQKHRNAESFLEAFENMGKKASSRFDNKNTLENLTKNKDNNKINARLLALMNYYDVLGVSATADEDAIKRAYKKKALELHPDRVGRDQTTEEAELFKVITKAHEVLTDPSDRAKYDEQLLTTGYGAPAPQAPSPDSWYTQF